MKTPLSQQENSITIRGALHGDQKHLLNNVVKTRAKQPAEIAKSIRLTMLNDFTVKYLCDFLASIRAINTNAYLHRIYIVYFPIG